MSASSKLIAQDVADFHGWKTYGVGPELNAYTFIAEQAVKREFHLTGCEELLDYYERV
jgi:hypothetical protein